MKKMQTTTKVTHTGSRAQMAAMLREWAAGPAKLGKGRDGDPVERGRATGLIQAAEALENWVQVEPGESPNGELSPPDFADANDGQPWRGGGAEPGQ